MGEREIISFVVIFAILAHGYLVGKRLFPRVDWKISLGMGVVLVVALQSIVQTAWYYAGQSLGMLSDAISLLAMIAASHAIGFYTTNKKDGEEKIADKDKQSKSVRSDSFALRRLFAVALIAIALVALVFVIWSATNAATLESIRTPWPLLREGTLAGITIGWLTLLLSIRFVRSPLLAAFHAAIALAATTLIAALVYRVGFGFDGFLHLASENIIKTTGTLDPKPFYYIGQYVFTTWLSRLSELPLADIGRWLLPVASAFLLPLSTLLAFRHEEKKLGGFLALGLLPLAGFVATTPQGFSYLLALSALILSLGLADRSVHPFAPLILMAWAIAVHPLAGIPLFFVLVAVMSRPRMISWLFVVLAGLSVLLLFYILSFRAGTSIVWNLDVLFGASPWIERLQSFIPWIGNRFVLWPAWASLVARLLPLLLLIAAIKRNSVFIASAALLWIAATALKATGEFSFLIDYERGNYADRLNLLAIFCLIPPAMMGIAALWERVERAPRLIAVTVATFFVATSAALAYDSLPRHDALVTGRGWSTSLHDVAAVKLIDRDADDREYTVLANQSVSAAAVATLGFKRYAGDVFFYPIPTGGPLYETFLRMTYNEPSRDTVKDAAELGLTDLVYVVINDYWWRAPAVSEAIRDIANENWEIGEGKVKIYKFDLRSDSSASITTSTP